MKKLFNSKETMADDMIDGFVAAFPGIVARGKNPRVVRRAAPADPDRKVSVLIGNGCGHEPIAMGFVGNGLLDANVVGDVFAAPSPDLILEGITEVTGSAGALLLISRHEGDVINGNAAAMMAEDDGLDVRPLLMYDDISSAPKGEEDERRGAAGTMFIYKIAGAAAEEGMGLGDLVTLAEDVRSRTRTLGAAVRPGISPLTGEEMFALPEDEVFIGMGVHGEPGVARRKVEPVKDLVAFMVDQILEDRPIDSGGTVCTIVNGSGGTTLMELLTIYREASALLDRSGNQCRQPDDRVILHNSGNLCLFDIPARADHGNAAPLARSAAHTLLSGDHRGRSVMTAGPRIHGVAVDAGSGLEKAIRDARGARAEPDDLLRFKRAVLTELGPGATTVLLDASCGPDLLKDYPPGCAPMLALEADVYHISDDDRMTVLPENLTVSDYPGLGVSELKFFMYYAPDDDPELNARKLDQIAGVGTACREHGLRFLLEPLVYHPHLEPGSAAFAAAKPDLVRRATRDFANDRLCADVLKVEVPVDLNFVEGFGKPDMTRSEALSAMVSAAEPAARHDLVYLSAGVPFDRFEASIRLAAEAGVGLSGFMCGRALWSDAVGIFGDEGEAALRGWLSSTGRDRLSRLIDALE